MTTRNRALLLRLVSTLSVAIVAWNLDFFYILNRAEEAFRNIIVDGYSNSYGRCSAWQAAQVLTVIALTLALPAIERPFLMLVFSLVTWAVYALVVVLIPIEWDFIPPIMAPLVVMTGGTILMGTVSWQLERSNRLRVEALDRSRQLLVDMLVHDIRQRSGTVLTTLSLLKSRTADETSLTLMQSGIERILMLVNNLMDIRKADHGVMRVQLKPVEVDVLVRDCIREHQSAADLVGVPLVIQAEPGLRVLADTPLMERVLTNLFWNALQHAPAATPVEVSCKAVIGGVEIQVVNRGPVMSAQDQAAIFTPYAAGQSPTALPTSTGLGLVFCKHAIEAHGGSIQLESPPQGMTEGVAVRLMFPRAP